MFDVAVPVDLRVKVIAVQSLRAAVEIVVYVPGLVGIGDQRQELHHGRVQAGSGNDIDPSITGKHRAACAIQIPGEWIEDHSLTELRGAPFRGGHHDRTAIRTGNGRSQLSAEIARTKVARRD